MAEYLGETVDDEFLGHLVDAYIDSYHLAGGENLPEVAEVVADMTSRAVTSALGAAYAGRERARREDEDVDPGA